MAAKSKKKAPAKKTAAKKAAPRKAAKPKARTSRARKPKGKATEVPNHRFAPGTEVSFLPVHMVTVERDMNREPFAKPIQTAKVDKNGVLEVRGLAKGNWAAAGPIDEAGKDWRYVQFSVK